jgi:hypothetical protein
LLRLVRELINEFYRLLGDVCFNVSPIFLHSVSQIVTDLALAVVYLSYTRQCFIYNGHELSTQNDVFASPLIVLHTTDRHCEDRLRMRLSLTHIYN